MPVDPASAFVGSAAFSVPTGWRGARVRSLMRHRNDLVQMASQHVQPMQKSLTQMNVQFQHVINDITGLTGLAIPDAILAGERDPPVLAKLRDPRVKANEETIRNSLEGNWRAEHILALKQRLSLYRSHRNLINECEQEIEKLVAAFEPRMDSEEKPMPADRKQKQRKRQEPERKSRLQPASRGIQTVRRGPHSDSRADDAGLHAVQRSRPRHVSMAHRRAFRLLAWTLPRQRHPRRKGSVARRSPDKEPRRNPLPVGGTFPCIAIRHQWDTISAP